MLFRSRINYHDKEMWHITSVTPPPTHPHWRARVSEGGHRGDMPQLFITMVDSTSEKHHTVIHIDSGDLVVTYSLLIHQQHEEISNTHPVVPFTGVRVAARGGV
jgi:Cu/Zn superoxide dismutase